MIFVLKGLLSRNSSHPASVKKKKKIITFCLGGTFLIDPAFKLFVFSIESRKLLHTEGTKSEIVFCPLLVLRKRFLSLEKLFFAPILPCGAN